LILIIFAGSALAQSASPASKPTFGQFTKRFETDQLKELFEQNREALKVAV
jgi:hypothetical protein